MVGAVKRQCHHSTKSRSLSTAPTFTQPARRLASTLTAGACSGSFRAAARCCEEQECSPIRPLIDWLRYTGYTVVTKLTKEFIDASDRRKVKGNMDIELAVDAMELAEHIDQIVLFTGFMAIHSWSASS